MGVVKRKKKKKIDIPNILIHLFFTLSSVLLFIIPFLMVVSVSLTSDDELLHRGYHLIPEKISLTAYQFAFSNLEQILRAYAVTAFQAFLGTFLAVAVMSMCAYTLSRPNFLLRKALTGYIFFTMVFSGGLMPSYIIKTKYLGLGNSIWVYVIPGLVVPLYIIIMRTFFKELPQALSEVAKIDGAGEFIIFMKVILPLSKPVLATVSLLLLLDKWNDWQNSMIYIQNPKFYTLQYLLQKILLESQTVQSMIDNLPPGYTLTNQLKMPIESLRYAMCIIAAGPMLCVFPFFQKYFTKGMTIGAVKG